MPKTKCYATFCSLRSLRHLELTSSASDQSLRTPANVRGAGIDVKTCSNSGWMDLPDSGSRHRGRQQLRRRADLATDCRRYRSNL